MYDFERNIKNTVVVTIVATLIAYLAIFGFIGWVIIKLLQHFGII